MANTSMGEIISTLRKEKGMTQKDIADQLGTTDKAVSKWERDIAFPDTATIPKLAEILGVSVEELMQAKSVPTTGHKGAGYFVEGKETEKETALREVYEETNLRIELIHGFRTTDEYFIPEKKDTVRQITYFLGVFENQNVIYQKEELSGVCLVPYEEAMELFQFESSRRILTEANEYLKKMGYHQTSRRTVINDRMTIVGYEKD